MDRKAGRGNPIITERKLRKYLGDQDPPIAGTSDIGEEFDVSRKSVINRLETFENQGIVQKVEIGRSFGWWLQEEEPDPEDQLEAGTGSVGPDESSSLSNMKFQKWVALLLATLSIGFFATFSGEILLGAVLLTAFYVIVIALSWIAFRGHARGGLILESAPGLALLTLGVVINIVAAVTQVVPYLHYAGGFSILWGVGYLAWFWMPKFYRYVRSPKEVGDSPTPGRNQ